MQLFPVKTKFKKQHRRRKILKKLEANYNYPLTNFSGLKALSSFRFTAVQMEASRKVVAKYIRKKFKIKLRFCLFPDLAITKKSAGVRMGKGKGNVDFWCFLVKSGRILFEIDKRVVPKATIFKAFSVVGKKLPGFSKILL